ncbi:hypothetical protein B0H16DRAFT_1731566 [Mycena metata]|uniref:Uncharacterized protein n=1 Tax=Mycena metata TaxID=1033252 RepID=A0AAD7I6K0_9AGAR|nr:hypothetical protein B0H16DRAFT_1731566 [Mycena metata]
MSKNWSVQLRYGELAGAIAGYIANSVQLLQLPEPLYLQNDSEKPFPPSSAHQSSPNLRLCTD